MGAMESAPPDPGQRWAAEQEYEKKGLIAPWVGMPPPAVIVPHASGPGASFSQQLREAQERRATEAAQTALEERQQRLSAEAERQATIAGLNKYLAELKARRSPIQDRYDAERAKVMGPVESRYQRAVAPINAEIARCEDELKQLRRP